MGRVGGIIRGRQSAWFHHVLSPTAVSSLPRLPVYLRHSDRVASTYKSGKTFTQNSNLERIPLPLLVCVASGALLSRAGICTFAPGKPATMLCGNPESQACRATQAPVSQPLLPASSFQVSVLRPRRPRSREDMSQQ